jgi:hypothetical protein
MSTDDASSANRAPVQRWSSTRAWGGGAPGGAVAGHAAEELRAEHRQGTGPEQHRGAGAEELWTEEGWGALGETKQMTEPMRETGTYGFDGFFWSRLFLISAEYSFSGEAPFPLIHNQTTIKRDGVARFYHILEPNTTLVISEGYCNKMKQKSLNSKLIMYNFLHINMVTNTHELKSQPCHQMMQLPME